MSENNGRRGRPSREIVYERLYVQSAELAEYMEVTGYADSAVPGGMTPPSWPLVQAAVDTWLQTANALLEQARENLTEALALYFEDGDIEVGEAPVIVPIDLAV